MTIEIPWRALFKLQFLAALVVSVLFFYWLIGIWPYLQIPAQISAPSMEMRADRVGRLAFAPFREGSMIKEGEILFSLDAEEEKWRQGELQAEIDSLQEKVAFHLDSAEKAMQDYLTQRCEEDAGLFESGSGHQSLVLLQENQSQAALYKEQLAASKASLEHLKQQVHSKSIVAPFSGVVVKRQKKEGEIVQCGDLIYSFCDPSRPWVEAVVPEKAIHRIALGQLASIQLTSRKGCKWEGVVSWISPIALPNREGVPIRISFKEVDSSFLPNLSADVKIKVR